MTKDDIIRMAREVQIIDPSDPDDGAVVAEIVDILTRFAVLVAAHAAAAEREACAKLVNEIEARCIGKDVDDPPLSHVAAAIRERSQS